MKGLNLEIKNPSAILDQLAPLAQNQQGEGGIYLRLPAQHDYQNPLNLEQEHNILGMHQALLPELLYIFGIRSMTLQSSYDTSQLQALNSLSESLKSSSIDSLFSDPRTIELLRGLFACAKTIAFDDWQNFTPASQIWNRLLTELIAPQQRVDFQFIFYMGSADGMPSFEVDRALELIWGFASSGEVTLALDQAEAVALWRVLSGVSAQAALGEETIVSLKKKYYAIFRILQKASLLVYSADTALLFAPKEQFVLNRKTVDAAVETAARARENFILGYATALHYGLGQSEGIALGLIVFGACGAYGNLPGAAEISAYIRQWQADLQRPESMNLYQ